MTEITIRKGHKDRKKLTQSRKGAKVKTKADLSGEGVDRDPHTPVVFGVSGSSKTRLLLASLRLCVSFFLSS